MARAKMTISEKEEPQHQGVAVQWGPDQDADKLKRCVASPVLLRSCLLPEQACQTLSRAHTGIGDHHRKSTS